MFRVLWIVVGVAGRWWPAEESEPPEAALLRRRPRLKKLPALGANLLAADGEHTS